MKEIFSQEPLHARGLIGRDGEVIERDAASCRKCGCEPGDSDAAELGVPTFVFENEPFSAKIG